MEAIRGSSQKCQDRTLEPAQPNPSMGIQARGESGTIDRTRPKLWRLPRQQQFNDISCAGMQSI